MSEGGSTRLRTIEGIYLDGRVELTGVPKDVRNVTQVLVTFIEAQLIDTRARGIDEAYAAEFRSLGHIRRGLGQPRDGRLRGLRCRQSPYTNAVM